MCITPCFREGLLFQCHVLSAKERHNRRWQSTRKRLVRTVLTMVKIY
jgi:hypothetical protein